MEAGVMTGACHRGGSRANGSGADHRVRCRRAGNLVTTGGWCAGTASNAVRSNAGNDSRACAAGKAAGQQP